MNVHVTAKIMEKIAKRNVTVKIMDRAIQFRVTVIALLAGLALNAKQSVKMGNSVTIVPSIVFASVTIPSRATIKQENVFVKQKIEAGRP